MTGMEINISKSKDWKIYFSSSTETDDLTFLRTIEPFLLNLDENDYKNLPSGSTWDIVFNTTTNKIELKPVPNEDCPYTSIGGFMVVDCGMAVLYPNDTCIQYSRVFDSEFQQEYNKNDLNFNTCTGEYFEHSPDFNTAFNTEATEPNQK